MNETHQYRNIFAEAYMMAAMFGWNATRPVVRAAQALRLPRTLKAEGEAEQKPRQAKPKKAAAPNPVPQQFHRLHRLSVPPLPRGMRPEDPQPR